jgi:hypothetical protein
MSEGEIRKIDKEAGKVTIKHGPLINLDMPAMTMIFRVKDPAMLDQVKVGDKISFVADKVNGQITVTQVEVKHWFSKQAKSGNPKGCRRSSADGTTPCATPCHANAASLH